VRLALIRLAKQYGRYGYRKIGQLLRIEGWCANQKKVERISREEGLQLPKRHKRLHHHDAPLIRLRPHSPNPIGSIDFVDDKLSNHRPYAMLTVIDEHSREALSASVANAMGSSEVLEALYPPLLNRGTPEYLGSDQGPGFSSEPFKDWLKKVGIKPIRIYPGSPRGKTV
jgi:putative transposase